MQKFVAPTNSGFNPRSREGSDRVVLVAPSRVVVVSIHAPARGATPGPASPSTAPASFNPRSREGSDVSAPAASSPSPSFQSTLPRGERRGGLWFIQVTWSVSIHAPARGATLRSTATVRATNCFNPRSREGSDGDGIALPRLHRRFNPRSREGSDGPTPSLPTRCRLFQSTLPRGERRRRR